MIDLEGRTLELTPRQGFTIPKGVMHRTASPQAPRGDPGLERAGFFLHHTTGSHHYFKHPDHKNPGTQVPGFSLDGLTVENVQWGDGMSEERERGHHDGS